MCILIATILLISLISELNYERKTFEFSRVTCNIMKVNALTNGKTPLDLEVRYTYRYNNKGFDHTQSIIRFDNGNLRDRYTDKIGDTAECFVSEQHPDNSVVIKGYMYAYIYFKLLLIGLFAFIAVYLKIQMKMTKTAA